MIPPRLRRMCATLALPAAMSAASPCAAADPSALAGDAAWSLSAGTEYGRDNSRGSQMSIDYTGQADAGDHAQPAFGLSGLHSDTPGAAARSVDATTTTAGQGYWRYGVEILRGGVGFSATRDDDYRHSQQWSGSLHTGAGGWAADVNISTRHTRFDGFPVTGAGQSRLNQAISTTGSAECSLHDLGIGGTLSYTRGPWTAYATGSANRYDPAECSFNGAVPTALKRLDAGGLQALTGAFLQRAQLRAGGQIGAQTSLLQSQFGAGLARSWGLSTVAVDYLQAKSEFGDTTQDGYVLSGTFPVSRNVAVKLTLGTTLTNATSAPYGGVTVLIDL